MGKNMFIQDKKAVSVIMGYVLLVSFVVIMGVIVYQWMRTYVPQDEINCPDGVSLFIEDYNCTANRLSIDLRNNGKFNVGGYFIYATNSPNQELATIDISRNHTDSLSRLAPTGIKLGGLEAGNSMKPDEKETEFFNITGIIIYSIEIVPIRWQEENNRNRLVSCKDAKIIETINCG